MTVMSDAAHLLSDLASFGISLIVVSVSRLPAKDRLSYGCGRSPVLSAFVSIIFLWCVTIVLVLAAVGRLTNPQPVNAQLMLGLGIMGLAINAVIGVSLGQSHSQDNPFSYSVEGEYRDTHHDERDTSMFARRYETFAKLIKDTINVHSRSSIVVQAAYLHVLGDAVQNVGAIFAAIVLMIRPAWAFLDPLCTFVFAIIVFQSTKRLAKETFHTLMEGIPDGIEVDRICRSLGNLKGVDSVAELHVEAVFPNAPVLSVNLNRDCYDPGHDIVIAAQCSLQEQFGIAHVVIQIDSDTHGYMSS